MRAALLVATVTADPDGRASFDALVMAAAVADFRPTRPAETKLARGEHLTLELEPTPDLLAEVGRIVRGRGLDRRHRAPGPRPARRSSSGFAAETGSLERAAEKLAPQGRRPPRRQRRRRGRLRLRDRDEPGHDLRGRRRRPTPGRS